MNASVNEITAATATVVSPLCGVKVTDARVSNFRSLENIEVELDDLTVLIGANNAGKTSFLDAPIWLTAALPALRRPAIAPPLFR